MAGNRKKRIIFVVNQSFPYGMASTNRIISLAKGISLKGVDVTVYCLRPSKFPNNENRNGFIKAGVYQGIKFEYTTVSARATENLFLKGVYLLWGIFNSIIIIIKSNKKQPIDQIWVSFTTTPYVLLYSFLAKVINSKYTLYRSEYASLERKGFSLCIFEKLISKRLFKSFDYFIIMTDRLKNYFDLKKSNHAKSILIPMSVEPERFFQIDSSENTAEEYIAYCGSINSEKDGVDLLIKAFNLIKEKYPSLKLYLIGAFQNNFESEKILSLINEFNLGQRLVLTGMVNRELIPQYLINSKILALARPNNMQNENGFPTKLGEYLITGKPVVVTAVGEIPNYLKNLESAFLSIPGDYTDFAEQLERILFDYKTALQIGQRGKLVALEHFDYRVQGEVIFNEIICEDII